MQDPEVYLHTIGAQVRCPVHAESFGVLHPRFRLRVNHEIFFFSSPQALDLFKERPLEYCGTLTDPVNGERFVPGPSSPRWEHNGRPYYFTSTATLETFRASPGAYADPTREMPD